MSSEPTLNGTHASLSEAAQSFVKWMNENNFDIHPSVQLRYVNSYQSHSVIASGIIEEEAKLFQVPKKCTLSWKNSGLRKVLPKLKMVGWNNLILAMMYEDSRPDSMWRSYLDILPQTLNTPGFWSVDQLAELKGTSIEESVGLEVVQKDYKKLILPLLSREELYSHLQNPSADEKASIKAKYYSFDQYRRFGSLIMAYSFSDAEDENAECLMVPMADMLNHKTGHNNARLFFGQEDDAVTHQHQNGIPQDTTEHSAAAQLPKQKKHKTSDDDSFLHMRTRRQINPEEELYNTYGTLPDAELLRRYGYVEELGLNRWNDVEVSVKSVVDTLVAHCNLSPDDITKRKSFIRKHDYLGIETLMFYQHQAQFGDFDPLKKEELEGGSNGDILILAKLFAATPEEYAIAQKVLITALEAAESSDDDEEEEDHEVKPTAGVEIEVANKNLVADLVVKVLQKRLSDYPSPEVEEDQQKLEGLPKFESQEATPESLRLRSAIIVRGGEKKILKALITDAEALRS